MTNTTLIKDIYAAFRRGDIPTILGALAADVQWTCEGSPVIPYAGSFHGPTQVARFFEGLTHNDNMQLDVEVFAEQGDIVASTGRFKGTVRKTGRSFDVPFGHFFTIRDGKIIRFIDLTDTGALVEAHAE
jgi:ketosteroid isomerase-like protein